MSIWDKCSASLAAWRTRSTLSAAAANASVHWARRRSLLALAAATSAWYIWWISCWARSTARFRGPSSTVAAASHVCNAVARSSRSMSAVAGSSGRLRGDPSSARLRSSGPARLNRVGLSCSSPASRMRHDSFTFFTAFAFLLLTFAKKRFPAHSTVNVLRDRLWEVAIPHPLYEELVNFVSNPARVCKRERDVQYSTFRDDAAVRFDIVPWGVGAQHLENDPLRGGVSHPQLGHYTVGGRCTDGRAPRAVGADGSRQRQWMSNGTKL
mmetsp:Transcript_17204/g.44815  ORF Transcript_17204/g.44815 Transcript_17204/m.44815 type:complete len:268 (+) Transcript_17204:350-1153(+)